MIRVRQDAGQKRWQIVREVSYNLSMGRPKPETLGFLGIIQKLGYPSMASLARKLGISRQRLSQAVIGPAKRTRFIRKRIAEALDLSYEELWGEPEPPPQKPQRRPTTIFLKHAHRAGYPTVAAVARILGLDLDFLLELIYGGSGHRQTREKIASLLGIAYDVLWGEQGVRIPEEETKKVQ
jgi:lambda repressor-like predicted transcriptional regulator